MNPNPTVIVWAHSPPWCSAISRQLGQFRLSWVLSYDSLYDEALKIAASAVVMEIPDKSFDFFPANLARLDNNSFQIKTFTVGKLPNPLWEQELRMLGNCGHYGTLVEFPSLEKAIRRHHQHRINGEKSIEQNVWANLPWPTP
ncbi:hypothetical protein N9B37_00635 [bacterium]|nr:hypothetical protein [bacterium]MDB4381006.1 hypothetical protein [Mariniblastus sp.]